MCDHFEWDFTQLNKGLNGKYEVCPESKDTEVLNMYNIFNLQKRHCEWIACI
jgi:hypothetical protein